MDSHGSQRIPTDWRGEIRRRLTAAGLDPETESEICEELAQHLEDRYRELRAGGMVESDAHRAALDELDDGGRLGRMLRGLKPLRTSSNSFEPPRTSSNSFEPLRTLSNLSCDIRFAARLMQKAPSFTAVAVLTMAVCIGANVALFGVVDTVLLRPLGFPQPERLVRVFEHIVDANLLRNGVSGPNLLDWKQQTTMFSGMAAYRRRNVNISGRGEPRYVRAARASVELFDVLAVPPALGRTFTREEDRQVAHVTVVTHRFWQSQLASDPGILGQALDFDGEPYVVVGVLPATFGFDPETEVWIPLGLYPGARTGRGSHNLNVVARLREGATVARAQAELESIAARLSRQYPDTNAQCGIFVEPLQANVVRNVRPVALILLTAVGFVLLTACANIGGLLVARSAVRAREFAVRIALGASRARLVRQLVVESLFLAALGGLGGMVVAVLLVGALRRFEAFSVPRLADVAVDGRMLGATLAVTVAAGLIFGIAPALRARRSEEAGALRGTSRGAPGGRDERRIQAWLISFQVAFAVVLLVGAGLMVRTLLRLHRVDPGFDPRGVLAVDLSLSDARYPKTEDAARFYRQVVDGVAALPGVRRAALVSDPPLVGGAGYNEIAFAIAGRPPKRPGEEDFAYLRWITPDYFAAIGVPLVSGRFFTDTDWLEAPHVVIINAVMAARHFPDEDPVGRQLVIQEGRGEPRQIVGVVSDLRQTSLAEPPAPQMYTPLYQTPAGWGTLLVRTGGDPRRLATSVHHAVRRVDPQQPLSNLRTLEQAVAASIAPQTLTMRMLGAFAAVAVALAAIGVYGVVAFQVAARTREIAVRIALGARAADVVRLIARQGLAPAVVGVALGLAWAVILSRFLAGLLFEVDAADPVTFAATAALLLAAALVACLVPARRALRTEPSVALQSE